MVWASVLRHITESLSRMVEQSNRHCSSGSVSEQNTLSVQHVAGNQCIYCVSTCSTYMAESTVDDTADLGVPKSAHPAVSHRNGCSSLVPKAGGEAE